MSNKTKTNFISASVKKVLSLSLLVTGGVVMSSMALALLLQDTASSNNENVQVWGIQSRVQYLTGMTLSWSNSDRIKFEYKEDTNALNFNGAMNLHALVIGSTNQGATGSTVIGGNNNIVKWNWQNAAIIGGNKNTVTNTTTSIIAGATGSNITNVQDSAIFSAEGTIIGSDNTTDTMFIVWGKGHVARGRNTNFIAGSENIKTDQNAQNNVLIGKNIRSNQSNIFVWSNGNTELTPQKGSAFYVNSTSGFGLNTNNPQAALDISNGGLAFNKVYQLSEISDVNIAGVHTVVQKDGKQGVCGYNGSTWVPLTLNAEREGLCTASTQSTPPKHATSTISGAVQFSGQPVITNGTTLLHQVWSGGMNNNHGGWLTHPWIYKHTGPLDNGDYRCGIGFHMGNPTPDGMKNTDCKACSPITNQRDWRSNGKNDDCEFSCKAGFKKVGRTCTACEVGTYTTDGTVANSCASCTNKPANAHYTTNGINANACQWACDAGYHNVGWACKKAVWQKTDTYTCNVAGGKWKDDKIVTTYHCALEENRGVSVPENICNHWGAKPATTTVVKWDVNCNTPEWETTWNCPNPSCNTSRIAGKCGGVTEAVTCTQHKRDRAWNSYETRTQSQQKACTRACETAACGAGNGIATKYQPTALCAAGTASAVGGNASVWSWTCAQLDGTKNCSATKIPLQAGSCGSSHNINHNTLNAGSANLCNYGTVISFNENTAVFPNRWSWKCRGDNGAHNQDVNCIAHKPAPQAGQCAQAANACTVGTVKDATNIANGKRWSCEGLHGWSTDTTCSLCDNGYVYNSATNRCDPKCGAGYTLHNGVCVKWKCESAPVPRPPVPRPPVPRPPVPSTPGRCVGSYSEAGSCLENARWGDYWSDNFASMWCSHISSRELCEQLVWVDFETNYLWNGIEEIPSGIWFDGFKSRFMSYFWNYSPYTSYKSQALYDKKTWIIDFYITSFRSTDCDLKNWHYCTRDPHVKYFEGWAWQTVGNIHTVYPLCDFVGGSQKSCSSLTQTECGKQSWCTRTSWASSSAVPPKPSKPWKPGIPSGLSPIPPKWAASKPAAIVRSYTKTYSDGTCVLVEEDSHGNTTEEPYSDCSSGSPQYHSQLLRWEEEEQSWEEGKSAPKVPPIPWPTTRVARCIDDKWNVHPDAYCANAGAKPVCDAEWACAVPIVTWSHGCINATTKDYTSQCRTDLSLNNAISCNNAIEVKKHCLPMRRRDCAADPYRSAGGSDWAIDDVITWEFEKTLTWDPNRRLYKSSLPGQEAFGYEIVGACSRGEPKAWASCKSISWKYDNYCSPQRDKFSCEAVNVYEKKDTASWPITVWLFKNLGQCSVLIYDFNDWEEQHSSSCPWIHKKFFKYVDSCEWGVRKEVVCQSEGSKEILDDSSCDVGSKPHYNMVCWSKEFQSTPSTPPSPPASSSEDTSWLYRATSYSRRPECIWAQGERNKIGSSPDILNGRCDDNNGYFMAGTTQPLDWIAVPKWSFWDPLFVEQMAIPQKKIWIKDGYAYWDKDKTQPVEVWVFKLTQYTSSSDPVPYRRFIVASQGYWPGYQLWRGKISYTLQ